MPALNSERTFEKKLSIRVTEELVILVGLEISGKKEAERNVSK